MGGLGNHDTFRSQDYSQGDTRYSYRRSPLWQRQVLKGKTHRGLGTQLHLQNSAGPTPNEEMKVEEGQKEQSKRRQTVNYK